MKPYGNISDLLDQEKMSNSRRGDIFSRSWF